VGAQPSAPKASSDAFFFFFGAALLRGALVSVIFSVSPVCSPPSAFSVTSFLTALPFGGAFFLGALPLAVA